MGIKYEVQNWKYIDFISSYTWTCCYAGDSIVRAVWCMINLKIKGAKCFRLTCR